MMLAKINLRLPKRIESGEMNAKPINRPKTPEENTQPSNVALRLHSALIFGPIKLTICTSSPSMNRISEPRKTTNI